jgi:hypothetical protein
MNDQRNSGPDLEQLIRAAFADDLPAEVEAGMRERVRRFRTDPSRGAKPSAAWAFLSRRAVWAALSILMLIAGILLQGMNSRSHLADRISSVKSAYASLETPRR